MRERFIPGTRLIRYGEGDWNDSLQPADPHMRDWMVSSWTVALLFQQLNRYAEVLRRAGRKGEAADLAVLADAMRADFNRHLIRDGTVAGYALFDNGLAEPELLLHPSDTRTGLSYSLLPMTRSIIGGLFTEEQARHHLRLIREHLVFPDGVRLMDRPVAYHGGLERVFRRAESAAFFGREIGLMYVHAHLRYGEAMGVLGEAEALWEALQVVNPVGVAERVAQRFAAPAQRLFQQQRRGFSGQVSGERGVGAGAAGDGRGRWRVADLFERAGALYGPASLPCARDPAVVRGAGGGAGAAGKDRAGGGGMGGRRAGGATGGVGVLIGRSGKGLRGFLRCTHYAQRMHSAYAKERVGIESLTRGGAQLTRRAARCGLAKPRRRRPWRISGQLMRRRQSRPVRAFSIITTIGPWSIAR